MAQSNPILYHTEANGCIFFWLAVGRLFAEISSDHISIVKSEMISPVAPNT